MDSMMNEAKVEKGSKPRKVMRMTIERGKGGGHSIMHHMDGPYASEAPHLFGKGEGKKMLAHVAKHMGVAMPMSEGSEE